MTTYNESDYCTVSQASRYANVARRTVYNWISEGRLTIFRVPSGAMRLLKSELIQKDRIEDRKDKPPENAKAYSQIQESKV